MKRAILIILICVLVLTAVTVGAAAFRLWDGGRLTLILNGAETIRVEYGDVYQEPGAEATLKTGVPVSVDISGRVDTDKVGKYLIKYTAGTGGAVRTAYRNVYVVDSQSPVIKLTENPNGYTLPGQPYQEEGFFATDNYDGDLTDRVIRREADGKVIYTVSDAYGNTTTVERTIRYMDPAYPQILLEGGQMAFIMAGDNYQEPGYTSTDMEDGDLTSKVVVTGAVDNMTSGIYTLQYSVTNQKGMTTKLDRTVYVIPKPEGEQTPPEGEQNPENGENPDGEGAPNVDLPTGGTTIEPNGKTIYLTFDDGPGEHTGRLLDILAKYNVKATFFVVGGKDMSLVARAAQEGHAIAIHTYTHRYSEIYSSDDAFFNDLYAMQDLIYQHTGVKTMLTRFPGGSSNSVSSAYNKGIMSRLTKELPARGFQYFDWNVDSNDAGGAKTADEVFDNVTKGVAKRTNSVVLQHDTRDFSVDAIERIVAWGLCNGYTFKALDMDSPACHHGVNN
ncbi:MAG: DUF5011 domain-containing protein [Oscillospiraceae bacterium]|nr:DUF5011 domain-containing protein [Oscillospiraceae bacterium]